MSAVLRIADSSQTSRHVRFVPTAEVARSLNHFIGAKTGQPAQILDHWRGAAIRDKLVICPVIF